MDDRFDFILLSQAFFDSTDFLYVDKTYKAFGNDGLHFNYDINYADNNAVGLRVATALYYASDHLPVCLDVEMDSTVIVPSRQPEQMTLRAEGPGAGDLLPGESPSGAGTPVRIAGPSRMGCGPALPGVPQHSPIPLL